MTTFTEMQASDVERLASFEYPLPNYRTVRVDGYRVDLRTVALTDGEVEVEVYLDNEYSDTLTVSMGDFIASCIANAERRG